MIYDTEHRNIRGINTTHVFLNEFAAIDTALTETDKMIIEPRNYEIGEVSTLPTGHIDAGTHLIVALRLTVKTPAKGLKLYDFARRLQDVMNDVITEQYPGAEFYIDTE